MSAVISPSDLQRSSGLAEVSFKRRGDATVLDRLHQSGCAKIRLPKVHNLECPEAVLLNTSGGLTGGDCFAAHCRWGEGTRAIVTTQAAERVYRSIGGAAVVANKLEIGRGGSAFWLPQETLLFDCGEIERKFDADLAEDGRLLALESWMAGRRAMGEEVRSAKVADHWRIRRQGRLIFADSLRLKGNVSRVLERPAVAGGSICFATLLLAGPALDRLYEQLRRVIPCSVIGEVLAARILAADISRLRETLAIVIEQVSGVWAGLGLRLPRVWQC